MSLELTKQRLNSAKERIDKYIDQNIVTWATEEILLPAVVDIRNSISGTAARALKLEKTGFMKVDLVWDLRTDDDKPLSFYLEFGTDPHTIEPKEDGVLSWTGANGGRIYAKRVNHPGSKKHVGLVQNIKNERSPNLIKRIIRETQNHMEIDKIE